jgi:serine/threonine-protein kinase
MAKVFTITQGLENLGALKTGGQGSVYKGRRNGELITAVKILPTPIFKESDEDRNFRDFNNEVQKLKKVNEIPNPNIVKILSSGLSETGNFPFIEMEYIEGPDLEELLKSRPSPVFTIKVAIKVAKHLSNALAQCHKFGIKHGDIKSNNVKLNVQTSDYVLLDFGLAVMSDEQRRTSLRRAGAVEFMAPEQNEGQTLFQSDVYSFGILIFELLAGRVPFPLKENTETARNNVRLAHMEAPVPNMLSLRKKALEDIWTPEIREREMEIPKWLEFMIKKCLNKNPKDRFTDGIELHNFIIKNISENVNPNKASLRQDVTPREKQQPQEEPLLISDQINFKERYREKLQIKPERQSAADQTSAKRERDFTGKKKAPSSIFFVLLVLAMGLAAFLGYSYFKKPAENSVAETSANSEKVNDENNSGSVITNNNSEKEKPKAPELRKINDASVTGEARKTAEEPPQQTRTKQQANAIVSPDGAYKKTGERYTVKSIAHFHNAPDETTRRKAFINHWNNAVLIPQDDVNGFIYIVYTNDEGQTSRGWLRKQDLRLLK